MSRDIITVLTCPSIRTKYVRRTIDGLDREGAAESGADRVVVCDGPDPRGSLATCPWPVVNIPTGPSGTRFAMWNIFRRVVDFGYDRLLYCEDDLIVGTDAVRRALSVDIPDDCALANFFDWREFRRSKARGIHKMPVHGFDQRGIWGSLMLLIPRRTLEFLITKDVREWNDPWGHRIHNGDCFLSWILKTHSPWPNRLQCIPSLVDHAGENSTICAKTTRRASWFVGERITGEESRSELEPEPNPTPERMAIEPLPEPLPPTVVCRTCLAEWPCESEGISGHQSFAGTP